MAVLRDLTGKEKHMIRSAIKRRTTSRVIVDSSTVSGEVFGYVTDLCANDGDMIMLEGGAENKPGVFTYVDLKAISEIPQGKREHLYFYEDKMEVTCYEQDRA